MIAPSSTILTIARPVNFMSRTDAPHSPAVMLNISAVERETGLSKDVLRMWERRYGFPDPGRDDNVERQWTEIATVRAAERVVALQPHLVAVSTYQPLHGQRSVRQRHDDNVARSRAGLGPPHEQLVAVAQGGDHGGAADQHPSERKAHGDSVAA